MAEAEEDAESDAASDGTASGFGYYDIGLEDDEAHVTEVLQKVSRYCLSAATYPNA